MILCLSDLIAPLTKAQFSKILRTRSVTFLRGSDERRFEGLLD